MTAKPRILVAERNPENRDLLVRFLGQEGYEALTAAELDELDGLLSGEAISAALIDVVGFDRGIWHLCARLRQREVPFLVIASRQDAVPLEQGLTSGARVVLVKPLTARLLLGVVRRLVGENGLTRSS
jgi:DNA-binding response OmpR family regulator